MSRSKRNDRWSDIDGGMAFMIPYTLLRHANYRRLSPYGHKLIADLGCQYSGFNNGYLCGSYSLMQEQGWHSPTTLIKATRECEHYRLIVKTQQGGLNKPNLYAFTWRRIDEKAGHELLLSPTMRPSNAWKEERPDFKLSLQKVCRSQRSKAKLKAA